MKYLFIIGNGLDISLGMNTDYQSFYTYYQSLNTKDPDIRAMKESMEKGRYLTWADLEAGLGDYSKNLSSEEVFRKCLESIKSSLSDYLVMQYEQRKYRSSKSFLDDFYSSDQYLDSQVQGLYRAFLSTFVLREVTSSDLRIVTLNYTMTIEDILSDDLREKPRILHLHGSLDEGMVMGVNDAQQIANEQFRHSRDIIEDFVKPSFNEACLNSNNSIFEQWIHEAHVIVLFGTSLGDTDRKWWRLIGKELLNQSADTLIIYFPYDNKKDTQRHPNYRLRWSEAYQQELLQKFDIPADKTDFVLPRICVGINKPIFRLEMETGIV